MGKYIESKEIILYFLILVTFSISLIYFIPDVLSSITLPFSGVLSFLMMFIFAIMIFFIFAKNSGRGARN